MGEWLRYIIDITTRMVTTLYSGIHYESTGYKGFNWEALIKSHPCMKYTDYIVHVCIPSWKWLYLWWYFVVIFPWSIRTLLSEYIQCACMHEYHSRKLVLYCVCMHSYLLHKLLCEDVSGQLHVARDDVDQLARGEAQGGSMIIWLNQHRVKRRLHRTKRFKYLSIIICKYNGIPA